MHEWSQDASINFTAWWSCSLSWSPYCWSAVWHSLLAPSSSAERLQITLLSSHLMRLLCDRLSGGMYDYLTPQLQNETRSVPNKWRWLCKIGSPVTWETKCYIVHLHLRPWSCSQRKRLLNGSSQGVRAYQSIAPKRHGHDMLPSQINTFTEN